MNQSKYLKLIGKQLKCSSAKKKELMKQIASDISIAMENGKSFDEVITEMGSPAEVAAEFNENFGEPQIKMDKRIKIGLISGVVIVIILLGITAFLWTLPKAEDISKSRTFSEEEVIAKAKEVIALLDENDIEALTPIMTDEMKEALTEEVLQETKSMICEDFGTFQIWGNSYGIEMEQAGKKFAIIEIVASYENVSVVYQISFDKDMKLAGFYLR